MEIRTEDEKHTSHGGKKNTRGGGPAPVPSGSDPTAVLLVLSYRSKYTMLEYVVELLVS